MTADQTNHRGGTVVYEKRALRLLVVEDHADLRRARQSLFGSLGHEARFVGNVSSAFRAASEKVFDVLFSNIGLPDGDGWNLLRQIEQNGHRPWYVIPIGGVCAQENLDRSKAAGFAVHLVKPFPPEALEKVLEAAQARLSTATHRAAAQRDAASKSGKPCRGR